MKFETAVKKIEKALEAGKIVTVEYHRKWTKGERRFDRVDTVTEYEYKGETCKAITTWNDIVDGYSHIVDSVDIGG